MNEMTEAEQNAVAGELPQRYAQVIRKIGCLRERIRVTTNDLHRLTRALRYPEEVEPAPRETDYDLMGKGGDHRATINMPMLRSDLKELRAAHDEKAQIEANLVQVGLGDLIKK